MIPSQLCKITCYPYLFNGAVSFGIELSIYLLLTMPSRNLPYATDKPIVEDSDKMVILDKLLASMKERLPSANIQSNELYYQYSRGLLSVQAI